MKGHAAAFTAVALTCVVAPLAGEAQQTDEITFRSGKRTLHGFIYPPAGDGPFPAVLWNHGSERRAGYHPTLGAMFATRGYVLFVPHRRGHGRSPGEYIMDALRREMQDRGRDAWSRLLVSLQEDHLEDQIAALDHLKRLPYVDAKRTAVAGCSFGGIQTVLAAEREVGIRAAMAFAPAAQTWAQSRELRGRLLRAAQRATVPILLTQAENDYDLSPTRSLAAELQRVGKPHKLLIFPSFGQTAQDGHEFCVRGADIWASEFFSFLSASIGQ